MKKINKKDPYGIPNTNFTLIKKNDNRWKQYKDMRLKYGFDPSEFWSFSNTFCGWLLPRVEWYYKHVICAWEKQDMREFEDVIYDLWYIKAYGDASNALIDALEKEGLTQSEAVHIAFHTYYDCLHDISGKMMSVIQMGW